MLRSLQLLFFVLCITIYSSAQTSSINGKITNDDTGEDLIGANVYIVGTPLGVPTDIDGKFRISGITPGIYSIKVSMLGFSTKTITDIRLFENSEITINVNLMEETIQQQEVVVTARQQVSTESASLAFRKKSGTIGDGMSVEQIKRAPDANSGESLRRVTGVSIVDDKFVYVRGVSDRYNGAMLNGVSVSSTETNSDKKSFTFDMLPSSLLENMTVTKTNTPDMAGDISGGMVQINTLDFPEQQVYRVSITGSYNDITTGKTLNISNDGKKDWTGFDDGTRTFPSGQHSLYDLGKKLPNSWKHLTGTAPMGISANASLGGKFDIDDDMFGYIAALTYRGGYSRTQYTLLYIANGTRFHDGGGVIDNFSVLWGSLVDLHYKLANYHKFSIRTNFTQRGDDKLTNSDDLNEQGSENHNQVTEWVQRSLLLTQFSGEHNLVDLGKTEIDWRGFYSSSLAKEPDRRTTTFWRAFDSEDTALYVGRTERSWMNLDEYSRGGEINVTIPLPMLKVKLGSLYKTSQRHYGIKYYLVDLESKNASNNPDQSLFTWQLDSAFRQSNFGFNKWTMQDNSAPTDVYYASSKLWANYLMADIPFSIAGLNFRLIGGARTEASEQLVQTVNPYVPGNIPFIASVINTDVLPSVNFTWNINLIANLRLAYSTSVNRPEFRELSATRSYDYSLYEDQYGNPLLRRAIIKNYDIRFEIFPDIGEVFAFSVFNKDIKSAIEKKVLESGGGSNPQRTWFNSEKARNWGYELEARKSFGFISDAFSGLAITANYTRVYSKVEYEFGAGLKGEREIQGQSPYMINASLSYTLATTGTSVNVLYNKFGERLETVGDERPLDILELPYETIDLSLNQSIFEGAELRLNVKDAFARAQLFSSRAGDPYKGIFKGTTIATQLSITF